MTESTLLLFGALAQLFEDVAKGIIPAHVVAFVLSHMRQNDVVQLEDVPVQEWVVKTPNAESEMNLELSLFCKDVHDGRLDAAEATNHIRAVHSHIEDARARIMQVDLRDLGIQTHQLQFLSSNRIHNLTQLLAFTPAEFTQLRGEHSYYFVSTILEWASSIPLAKRLELAAAA